MAETTTTVAQRMPVKARLPYHPRIGEVYGINDLQWQALVESTYPEAATIEAVALALSYCRARGYDPMMKPVHIVPVWNSKLKKMVDTVWPSLQLYRTLAARTGFYAGIDPVEFGPDVEATLTHRDKDGRETTVRVVHPAWAKVTVYRIVKGVRTAFASPQVRWTEYYATAGRNSEAPNEQWRRRPFYMLEKVAESLALRRAFPEECADPTAEEMEAAGSEARDITPSRPSFRERVAGAVEAQVPAAAADEPQDPEMAATGPENEPEDAEEVPDAPPAAEVAGAFPGGRAWKGGAAAAEAGEDWTTCPHPEGDDRRDWLGGWVARRKDMED